MEDLKKLFSLIKQIILTRITVLILGSVLAAFGITSESCSFIDPKWQPDVEEVNTDTQKEASTDDHETGI